MSIHGAQVLSKVPIGAARGFFDLFYRLNTGSACCVATSPSTQRNPKFLPRNARARRGYSTTNSPSPSSKPANPEPALSTTLRHLMRTLPHSVVVLTTTSSPSKSSPSPATKPTPSILYERKGMTLSSFTTLTLTPTPIITFNIRKPSQTLSALMETRWFLIHILNGTIEGARVADRFTRGNREGLFEGLGVKDLHVDVDEEGGGRLLGPEEEGGALREGTVVLPRIENKGVGRVLLCEVEGRQKGGGFVEVGDHVVVVAGVRVILPHASGTSREDVKNEEEPFGLCYVDGLYRDIGGVIDLTATGEKKAVGGSG